MSVTEWWLDVFVDLYYLYTMMCFKATCARNKLYLIILCANKVSASDYVEFECPLITTSAGFVYNFDTNMTWE